MLFPRAHSIIGVKGASKIDFIEKLHLLPMQRMQRMWHIFLGFSFENIDKNWWYFRVTKYETGSRIESSLQQ